ncbi:uncharacterized protein CELE_C48A7.16, partial [Caenorhabditis elegans]
VVHEEGREI